MFSHDFAIFSGKRRRSGFWIIIFLLWHSHRCGVIVWVYCLDGDGLRTLIVTNWHAGSRAARRSIPLYVLLKGGFGYGDCLATRNHTKSTRKPRNAGVT